jgi:hypothetical protein
MPWTDMHDRYFSWVKAAGGVDGVGTSSALWLISNQIKIALLGRFSASAGGHWRWKSVPPMKKPNVILNLAALAQRFGLYASQGSDYHGINMPWLKLGRKFADHYPPGCQPVWELF